MAGRPGRPAAPAPDRRGRPGRGGGSLPPPPAGRGRGPAPLLPLPEIGGPAGYAGGIISIGIRLAVVEPRIAAVLLFAGSFVPRAVFEDARRVTLPVQVLLQWDDEGNDRQVALDLFDALGSREKTLHANMGGHTGVPPFEGDAGNRFFVRHLR